MQLFLLYVERSCAFEQKYKIYANLRKVAITTVPRREPGQWGSSLALYELQGQNNATFFNLMIVMQVHAEANIWREFIKKRVRGIFFFQTCVPVAS